MSESLAHLPQSRSHFNQKQQLLDERRGVNSRSYLRRYAKKVDGEEYGYWSLVESVRTASGPRQRIVASIGKLPD